MPPQVEQGKLNGGANQQYVPVCLDKISTMSNGVLRTSNSRASTFQDIEALANKENEPGGNISCNFPQQWSNHSQHVSPVIVLLRIGMHVLLAIRQQ